MLTCSGMRPTSSCSSRYIACSGVSPRSMPPCGNCQECERIRLPQNTWFLWLSRMMPTLGLKPSLSSIINPNFLNCLDYASPSAACEVIAHLLTRREGEIPISGHNLASTGRSADSPFFDPTHPASGSRLHESLPVFHLHPQVSPGRCRGGQPPTHDACRHDQETGCRHLQLHAHGVAGDPEGGGHRARGDEPRRRGRTHHAGGAAGRTLAGNRALREDGARVAAHQGPARPRLRG